MPAKHAYHVAFTEPHALFIREKIAVGAYASVSEIVRASLRLLIEREAEISSKSKQPSTKSSQSHHG
jgi:antitoxin ParD1/3/4